MDKLHAVLWRGALGLAVLYPVLFIQILRFPPFVARDDLAVDTFRPGRAASPSVVVLIFDSISMAQCLDGNGEWRSDLPGMGELRSNAVCFDHAVSCGPGTTISLPNLLFQRSPGEYHCNSWDDSWFSVDPTSFTNGVFYSAKVKGYRTGMLGYYLPFGQMFDSLLDGATDVPFSRYCSPDSFLGRCANQAVCILAYARGPFNGSIVSGFPRLRHVPGRLNEEYFLRMTRHTEELTRVCLSAIHPTGHLFVSFMAIPHSPAIFLADGAVDPMRATYDSQLRYADQVVGRLIETMKENGTYDACWVILTSDHGHHGFDLPYAQHRNVPFVVKPPGGDRARLVDDPINLWELGPFFGAVFGESDVADCLAKLLPKENPK
ncbi:MAG: sulfatase-like hydrolase/transferase [Kiritimatiellia bacterium]